MARRMICFLLSAMMVFGMCAMAAPQVSAANDLTVSENGIALIKEFEGFAAKPFYDYTQYSVGYGTACKPGDYPNGITKAQADQLLRAEIEKIEDHLNRFAEKYSLNWSQQQYDALVSFTYNLGTNWMNSASTFRSAVTDDARDNDFIFAMTMWCNAGGVINKGLVQRRLAEANLYLNGIYSKTPPSNYRYVIFDNNLESAVTTVKIQGFDANQTDKLRAAPSKSGYRFLGWYTLPEGGEWITTVGPDTGNTTLYGHWQDAADTAGVSAGYVRYAEAGQILYDAPNGNEKKQYSGGEKLTVVADFMDDSGIKWGKISEGSWVDLTKTRESKTELPGEAVNLKVVVTASDVNIRKGPGTSYAKVGRADKGQELVLTRVQQGGMYLWGQFSGGWICLDYTDYELAKEEGSGNGEKVMATGVIVGTDKLNVRSRPGTGNPIVGHYSRGDMVEITLRQQVGGTAWGKTAKGWISLYYVKLDGETSGSDAAPGGDVGTVYNCTGLIIRSGAGTDHDRVGRLAPGTQVRILETVLTGGRKWGRISQGWVCMDYIQLSEADSGSGAGTEETPSQPEQPQKFSRTGVIVGTTQLRVRKAPGVSNEQVGTLNKGDKVVILETAKVGSATWGRIEKGWIHMYYVRLSTAEVPEGSVVRTVTANLNIRAGAGTTYESLGQYPKGTQVIITERTNVGSTVWGRTDKGWISMDYVK